MLEFDNWYAESFLNQSEEPQTSVAAGHGIRPGIFIPYNPNVVSTTTTTMTFIENGQQPISVVICSQYVKLNKIR